MSRNVDGTKIFAEKYFSFLVNDFGFDKPIEQWVSREFHFEYYKNNIEIDIAIEADGTSLPWVSLTDHCKAADLDDTLTSSNHYYIESLEDNPVIAKIYTVRNERYNPMVSQILDEYKMDNYHEAHAALDKDYETLGRQELEIFLRENAEMVKRHIQILHGDLTPFPKRDQFSGMNMDMLDSTDYKTKKTKQQWFKSVVNLFNFLRAKSENKK